MAKLSNTINIENRRARFDYQFLDTLVAGLVLKGTEIKSIREGKAGLSDSYCYFRNDELFVKLKLYHQNAGIKRIEPGFNIISKHLILSKSGLY